VPRGWCPLTLPVLRETAAEAQGRGSSKGAIADPGSAEPFRKGRAGCELTSRSPVPTGFRELSERRKSALLITLRLGVSAVRGSQGSALGRRRLRGRGKPWPYVRGCNIQPYGFVACDGLS